ncbi:MAG TPA: response regulator [Luteibaculaceae bacterium]|nr:response regulator [Luteibaculaceae bacterium]
MDKLEQVCIIDDDPIYIFGAKRMIQKAEVCESIMVYRNGKEAFESLHALYQAQVKLPDVILLDLNMPIWDGWQFLDEFTKIPIEQKIILYIVTSSVDPADMEKAKKYALVSNFVVKPITSESIRSMFDPILGK